MSIVYHNPEGSNPAQGLYSNVGTINGGTIHMVAGQLSVGSSGEVVGTGDFSAQFDQVFKSLEDVLKGLGGDLRSVVKFTTFIVGRENIATFMDKRARLFPNVYAKEIYPPNTLLLVDGLVKPEFMIEVEAVAAI
jgi:enamine deaminase RidA (YjgF/YER057c/UK114 family)